jgi:ankyrin repeat protein
LHGHLEFSRALVSKKPKLAEEVDSLGRTPLHLASAEGHTEIVKALLQANTDVCLAFDQDGRIPLHLAAMRGRIEIIKELIIARRESIRVNLNGDSVLHLCVRYNHLDALKLLVESAN